VTAVHAADPVKMLPFGPDKKIIDMARVLRLCCAAIVHAGLQTSNLGVALKSVVCCFRYS